MSKRNKYKINVNRSEPTKKDINKYSDFNKILSSHRTVTKRPLYKRRRVYFILFIILVVLYGIYLSEKEENNREEIDLIEKVE